VVEDNFLILIVHAGEVKIIDVLYERRYEFLITVPRDALLDSSHPKFVLYLSPGDFIILRLWRC